VSIFLSKILPLALYPVGLACLILATALLLNRKKRRQQVSLWFALALLAMGGNHWFAEALARSLEWRYLPPAEVPRAEVIVVLGGGTEPKIYPRSFVEVNGAGDRIIYAAQLYRNGAAPKILLTGGRVDWDKSRSSSEAEEMAALFNLMGVPADALLLETRSKNTYENALFTREILEKKGVNRIILITSAMHMPRSIALFEKQGFQVLPAPTDYTVTRGNNKATTSNVTWPDIQGLLIDLVPSVDHLVMTTDVLREYLGMFIYWVRGYHNFINLTCQGNYG
jgi:uncharacterized SAM-binding protein YcdF (DUF218 family)